VRVVGGDVVVQRPRAGPADAERGATHSDDQGGERLVYGGHTIGLALTQAVRALPELVTVVAWHGCDHTDRCARATPSRAASPSSGSSRGPPADGWRHLRSVVAARSGPGAASRDVLDWRYVGLLP
jgi:hypothetical protein